LYQSGVNWSFRQKDEIVKLGQPWSMSSKKWDPIASDNICENAWRRVRRKWKKKEERKIEKKKKKIGFS